MTQALYRLIILLLKGIAVWPLTWLYVLSDACYLLAYHVFRYRRRMVRSNLRKAFPQWSEADIRKTERAFYRHLTDLVFETVKMLHMSDREWKQRVEVVGTELVERAASQGRPVFLFLGHYGNWEWGQEVTVRYEQPAQSGEIYKPLRNKVFDRVMQRIRSCFPHNVMIPRSQAVRTILNMKREVPSFLIGFIADQRPTRDNLYHWTTFLGIDTPYLVGGEKIGRRVDACFYYLDVEKPARGHYRYTIREMHPVEEAGEAFPYSVAYMRMMEQTIRREPAYWLWSHHRWKHQRTN